MYRLIRDNVVKLTTDPGKCDRLIADGYTWEQETPEIPEDVKQETPEIPEEKSDAKSAKGKAAADGKSTDKA